MVVRIMGLLLVPTTLRRITLTNLLSFGPEPVTLELQNLNILIGPNGSGKSNLIEAISLLRSTPVSRRESEGHLAGTILRGGGAAELIWKGSKGNPASIEVEVSDTERSGAIKHKFSFNGGINRIGFIPR